MIDKSKRDCVGIEIAYQKIQEKFLREKIEYDMYIQETELWELISDDFHKGLNNILNDIQGEDDHLRAIENFIKKYRDCNKLTNSELVQMERYVIHFVREIFYTSLQHLKNTEEEF